MDPRLKKDKKLIPKSEDIKSVYIICHKDIKKDVEKFIIRLANGDHKIYLKESAMFPHSLDPIEDYDGRIQGWLELDNGFMFFLDKEMHDKTVQLFSTAIEEKKT